MKTRYLVLAAAFALSLLVGRAPAAETKPASRVLAILEVETDDPVAYAGALKEYNAIAKAKLGIENYLRVYQTYFDGERTGRIRVAVTNTSMAELNKNSAAIEADPKIVELTQKMRALRKLGSRVLYQGVYFEAPMPVGVRNYTTLINVVDEDAYVKSIGELRALLDQNGFKDCRIGVYRVTMGRKDHTHRVVINTPSDERLAAFLDFVGSHPQSRIWSQSVAKNRTIVASNTSREITK